MPGLEEILRVIPTHWMWWPSLSQLQPGRAESGSLGLMVATRKPGGASAVIADFYVTVCALLQNEAATQVAARSIHTLLMILVRELLLVLGTDSLQSQRERLH